MDEMKTPTATISAMTLTGMRENTDAFTGRLSPTGLRTAARELT